MHALAQPRPDPLLAGSPQQRVLYFDIDGTLVMPTFGAAKPALARGAFERAVRAARFERLVCVSDALLIDRLEGRPDHACDVWRRIFDLCRGTFEDLAWFRLHVDAVADPLHRALAIDRYEDWYYVDDRALAYADRAGLSPLDCGRRILHCSATGDGSDVLRWLLGMVGEVEREDTDLDGWQPFPPQSSSVSSSFSSTPYVWRRV